MELLWALIEELGDSLTLVDYIIISINSLFRKLKEDEKLKQFIKILIISFSWYLYNETGTNWKIIRRSQTTTLGTSDRMLAKRYLEIRSLDSLGARKEKYIVVGRSISSHYHFSSWLSKEKSNDQILDRVQAYSRLRRRRDLSSSDRVIKLETKDKYVRHLAANLISNSSRY